MAFKLAPKPTYNSENTVTIDYEAIAAQVEEGTQPARISLIVDLGIQERTQGFSSKKESVHATEEEAEEYLALVREVGNDASKAAKITEKDGSYTINGELYDRSPVQQVAIFADLPETLVTYVEGEEEKPYRVMLNTVWQKELKGFDLIASPPSEKGGLWTFGTASVLHKLAKATKQLDIISDTDDNMNVGLLLGEAFLANIEKNGNFIKNKGYSPLMKNQKVDPLPFEAVGISFDEVTVAELQAAKLRKSVIDKIKQATNYSGSRMERAVKEYEASFATKAADKEESPVVSKPKPSTKPKAKVVQDDVFDDSEIPF